jgi:conjugal transfer pilus assembly protein TraW
MKVAWVLILALSTCNHSFAKSFGIVGEVFPVAEKSFLTLIEERLTALQRSGELASLNQQWVETAAKHANRPTPLNLPRTLSTSRHNYVPEITLSQDIVDSQGHVLYAKGTRVNALSQLPSFKPCWLFFNADDKAQIHWAEKQKTVCPNPKFILTGGAVSVAEKRLQSIIYFDQAGRITAQLQVVHVPAMVNREKFNLVIHEQAIKENGDVL